MNNYLASGGEIDLRQTNDICKWTPNDRWGEDWKCGYCNGEDFGNIKRIRYALFHRTFFSQPIISSSVFLEISKYQFTTFNQKSISLN